MLFSEADYQPLSIVSTFTPSNQDQLICFTVVVRDDDIVEENELLYISLSSEDPSVQISPEMSQLQIIILDGDGKNIMS